MLWHGFGVTRRFPTPQPSSRSVDIETLRCTLHICTCSAESPCDVPVVDSAVIRCPGRFFAEMELVLLVLMVLQRLQLTPEDLSSHHKSRGHEQHNRTAGCNKVVKSILAGGGKAVSRLLPSFLVSWGYDLAIYGAGLFEGSRLQAGTWFGSAGQWQSLPPPDLLRLVGFKVPQGTWWVRVQ